MIQCTKNMSAAEKKKLWEELKQDNQDMASYVGTMRKTFGDFVLVVEDKK